MTDIIDFSKQYEYEVNLNHEKYGVFGKGILSFGAGQQACLKLSSLANLDGQKKFQTITAITAITINGDYFTLFDCTYADFGFYGGFYVGYVITGDINTNNKLDRIGIQFNDVSEWFLRFQKNDRVNHIKVNLNVNVKSKQLNEKNEQFSVESEFIPSSTENCEEHLPHCDILFNFKKTSTPFALGDIKTKALELSVLLSLLIVYPISIASVQVTSNSKNHFVYFPAPTKNISSNPFCITKCFSLKTKIENRWQTIFEKYYSSSFRKDFWARFVGMMRYEGFLEYKILGYVSFLDQYVNQCSKKTTALVKQVDVSLNPKFKKRLRNASLSLNEYQQTELMGIVDEVFGRTTFQQKYHYAVDQIENDIRKIINISEKNFKEIKKVRDAIAHGDDPKLSDDKVSQNHKISNKIALLLTFWAFKDLGLTDGDFKDCLSDNHNRILLRADINQMYLDRIKGQVKFFDVSKEQWENIRKQLETIRKKRAEAISKGEPVQNRDIRLFACFIQHGNCIEYSEQYSDAFYSWRMSPNSIQNNLPDADFFGIKKGQIEAFSHAYLVCEENSLEFRSGLIIKHDEAPVPS